MEKVKIVLASNNAHKLEELRSILSDYEILSLKDVGLDVDIEENGTTFEENALIKARFVQQKLGKTAISDDSGLCVDVLGGAPGVYSARYSGKGDSANNEKLLKELSAVPFEERTSQFVSAAGVVFENGEEAVCLGITPGKIGFAYKGEGGFGYDPLFTPEGMEKTYAEMTPEEKNTVSHRRRAFEALRGTIDSYYKEK